MPDGFEYDGDWLEGVRHGAGVAKYVSGDVYEGQFLAGQRHGQGTLRYATGQTETGNWENGLLTGAPAVAEPEAEPVEGSTGN